MSEHQPSEILDDAPPPRWSCRPSRFPAERSRS